MLQRTNAPEVVADTAVRKKIARLSGDPSADHVPASGGYYDTWRPARARLGVLPHRPSGPSTSTVQWSRLSWETIVSFGFIVGVAVGADLLNVPPQWIGVGVLCLIGVAIVHGATVCDVYQSWIGTNGWSVSWRSAISPLNARRAGRPAKRLRKSRGRFPGLNPQL